MLWWLAHHQRHKKNVMSLWCEVHCAQSGIVLNVWPSRAPVVTEITVCIGKCCRSGLSTREVSNSCMCVWNSAGEAHHWLRPELQGLTHFFFVVLNIETYIFIYWTLTRQLNHYWGCFTILKPAIDSSTPNSVIGSPNYIFCLEKSRFPAFITGQHFLTI